jgi:hypothetical protein
MRWAPAIAIALLACERFDGGGSPATPAIDGSVPTNVGDAGDAGEPSDLVLSAGFEGATGGECGGAPWDSYQSTSDVVAGGKVGDNACHFCGDPGVKSFTVNSPLFAPARVGDKYVGHAWFKLVAPADVNAALVIRARPSRVESTNAGAHVTTTEWTELTAELDVPASVPATDNIDAYVVVENYADAAHPPCALTDAIEIRRKE